jgi:hypothetical protein
LSGEFGQFCTICPGLYPVGALMAGGLV